LADIKRMNYFDQQFLVVGDFIAEQAYHREMRLLHNRSLHTYGVAKGLDVTLSGAREVMISAGVAIDNQGREIALSDNTPHTLTNDPAGGPLLITISYDDEETDPYSALPGKNTRIRETFSITDIPEESADPDTQAVTLARVKLDAQRNIAIDVSARRWAGPLSDETSEVAITLGRLRLGGKSIPNSQWPSLTASGPNQLKVSGGLFAQSLEATGDITLNGSLKAGGDLSGRHLSVTGALSAPNATINGALIVAGAIVPSVGDSPQAGIQFPSNPGGGTGDEAFIRYFVTAGSTTKLQIGIGNDLDDSISLVQAGAERLTVVKGNVGIGTTNPENSEGWHRVLDLLGNPHAKLSVRTNAIDARVMANEGGWWGAPAGMIIGTKSNHSLSFATNSISRLTILGNGNIGVGTSAPHRTLTIAHTGESTQVFASLKNDKHEILLGVSQTAVVSAMTNSDLHLRTNNENRIVIAANGNVGIGTMTPTCALDVRAVDAIKLGTNNANRMVIAANGNVGIGTMTPAYPLDVRSGGAIKLGLEGNGGGQLILANNAGDNKIYLEAFSADGNGSAAELLLTGRNVEPIPTIKLVATTTHVTGAAIKPGGGSWGNSSDLRLKRKIEPLTGALEKLLQLRGVCFEWVEPEKMGNQHGLQRGLIAQEVESVFPEWISTGADGYKLLSIIGFEALMIEALRELKSEIEGLKSQPAELAGKRPSRSERKSR
jgi:Chaperone of endosialidase